MSDTEVTTGTPSPAATPPADVPAAATTPAVETAEDLFGGKTQADHDREANEKVAEIMEARRAGKPRPQPTRDQPRDDSGRFAPLDSAAAKADDAAAAQPTVTQPAAADPFAALPEPVRQRLAESDRSAKKAEQDRLAAVGQMQRMQRELAELRRAQPASKPESPAPTPTPDAIAPVLKQVEDDYPELKGLVGAIRQRDAEHAKAAQSLADQVKSLQTRLDGEFAPTLTRVAGRFEDLEAKSAREIVTRAHPDAFKLYTAVLDTEGNIVREKFDPQFASWLYAQDEDMQDRRFSGDPNDAAKMFAAYAQHQRQNSAAPSQPAIDPATNAAVSAKAESRQRNLAAAVAPDIKPNPAPKPIRSLDDFESEDDAVAFLLEQKKRARQGR